MHRNKVNSLGNPCDQSWRRMEGYGEKDLQKSKVLSLDWTSEGWWNANNDNLTARRLYEPPQSLVTGYPTQLFLLPAYQSINQSTFKVAKDRRKKKPSFVPESITTRLSTSKIIQIYEKIQQHIYTVSRKKDPKH